MFNQPQTTIITGIPDNIKAESEMFNQRPSTDCRPPAAPVEDARSAAAGDVNGRMEWDLMVNRAGVSIDRAPYC